VLTGAYRDKKVVGVFVRFRATYSENSFSTETKWSFLTAVN
jgi:hypothetical protein